MRKLIKKALAPLVRELVQEQLKEIEDQNKIDTEQCMSNMMENISHRTIYGPLRNREIGRFYKQLQDKKAEMGMAMPNNG